MRWTSCSPRCEADGVWARQIPVDYASHSVHVEATARASSRTTSRRSRRARAACRSSRPSTAEIIDTAALDARLLVPQPARNRVRFDDVRRGADRRRRRRVHRDQPAPGADGARVGGSRGRRRRRPGRGRRLAAPRRGRPRAVPDLARPRRTSRASPVDWSRAVRRHRCARVDAADLRLPAPALLARIAARRRRPGGGGAGRRRASAAERGAAELRAIAGRLFTGRVSLAPQPWLADHAVFGRVLFPATAFVELALTVGAELGCGGRRGADARGAAGADRRRRGDAAGRGRRGRTAAGVRSRSTREPTPTAPTWVRHASGSLGSEVGPATEAMTRLRRRHLAAGGRRAARRGLDVRPAGGRRVTTTARPSRAPSSAWRDGEETFCRGGARRGAGRGAGFGVHPALLDASLHAALHALDERPQGTGVRLPFALGRRHAAPQRGCVATGGADRPAGRTARSPWPPSMTAGQPVLELESPVRTGDRRGSARRATGATRCSGASGSSSRSSSGGHRAGALGGAGRRPAARRRRAAQYDDLRRAGGGRRGGRRSARRGLRRARPRRRPRTARPRRRARAWSRCCRCSSRWLSAELCREARLVLVTRGGAGGGGRRRARPRYGGGVGSGAQRPVRAPGPLRAGRPRSRADAAAVDWPALLAADEPQLAVRRGIGSRCASRSSTRARCWRSPATPRLAARRRRRARWTTWRSSSTRRPTEPLGSERGAGRASAPAG